MLSALFPEGQLCAGPLEVVEQGQSGAPTCKPTPPDPSACAQPRGRAVWLSSAARRALSSEPSAFMNSRVASSSSSVPEAQSTHVRSASQLRRHSGGTRRKEEVATDPLLPPHCTGGVGAPRARERGLCEAPAPAAVRRSPALSTWRACSVDATISSVCQIRGTPLEVCAAACDQALTGAHRCVTRTHGRFWPAGGQQWRFARAAASSWAAHRASHRFSRGALRPRCRDLLSRSCRSASSEST